MAYFTLIWTLLYLVITVSGLTCPSTFQKYLELFCVYHDSSQDRTKSNALQYCQNLVPGSGGKVTLINAHDPAFHTWLESRFSGEKFWLTVNDEANEGKYYWADGESYTSWAAWKSDEPKDDTSKRCVTFKDGEWLTEDCGKDLSYFCQYTMLPSDAACITGYQHMPGTQLCFSSKSGKKTFQNADNDCDTLPSPHNGYLAKVENKAIFDFIRQKWSSQDHWIGLSDAASMFTFLWTDDTVFDFPAWMGKITEKSSSDNCYVWENGDWKKKKCGSDSSPAACQISFPQCTLMKQKQSIQTYGLKKTSGKAASNPLTEIHTGLQRCAQHCIKDEACGSFNFNVNLKICQLNSYCQHDNLVTTAGYDYWQ